MFEQKLSYKTSSKDETSINENHGYSLVISSGNDALWYLNPDVTITTESSCDYIDKMPDKLI